MSRSRPRCALSRPTRRSSLASDIGSVVSRRAIAPTWWRSIQWALKCWTPGSPECEPKCEDRRAESLYCAVLKASFRQWPARPSQEWRNKAIAPYELTSLLLKEEEWRAPLIG